MTLVKICGIRDVETARVAASAGADFIGLMFAPSRRQVTPEAAFEITQTIRQERATADIAIQGPGRGEVSGRSWFAAWSEAIEDTLARARPLVVGVFAGQDPDVVQRIATAAELDLVQFSGGEETDAAHAVDRPAIVCVHVGDDGADAEDRIVPGAAAGILLDTRVDGAYGGTGTAFDWSIAAAIGERTPVMLAGGLTPENVGDAIEQAHPWAVDVSTGVEINGSKDHARIRAFIAAAKGVRQ